MENSNNSKDFLRIVNNLNDGLDRFADHILNLYKLVVVSIILTIISVLLTLTGEKAAIVISLILCLLISLISIFAFFQLFEFGKKLKSITNENDSAILESLKKVNKSQETP